MSHKDALALLFPVELGGVEADDITVEGKTLDDVESQSNQLLREMFPDMTYMLLTSWERVLGLVPGPDATLQSRRDHIIAKIRERGGLSRAYFISLAAALGYAITIDELQPFMAGWGRAGDPLYIEAVRFVWRVNITGQPVYYFRTGLSCASERLLSWLPVTAIEDLFRDLEPAHTFAIFNYA